MLLTKFCCDASNEDDKKIELRNKHISDIRIMIVTFKKESPTILPEAIHFDNISFELRTIVSTYQIEDEKWNGFTYSRHGGTQFYSWWYNEKNQAVPVEIYISILKLIFRVQN